MKTRAYFQAKILSVSILLAADAAHGVLNVTISNGVQSGGSFAGGVWTPTSSPSVINVTNLLAQLNSNATVTINTNGPGAEAGDINIASTLPLDDLTTTASRTLTLNAFDDILVNASVTQSNPGGDNTPNVVNLIFNADSNASGAGSTIFSANVNTGGGSCLVSGFQFSQAALQNLDTLGGLVSINVTNAVFLLGNSITTAGGGVTITAGASSTLTSAIATSGGNVTGLVNGAGNNLSVSSGINVGGGAGVGSIDLRSINGGFTLNSTALLSSGASGSVTLRGSTGMTLTGDVNSAGALIDIDVTGIGNLIVNGASLLSAQGGANTGVVDLRVANGTMTFNNGSQVISGSAGSVSIANSSALNDISLSGAVSCGSGGVIVSSFRNITLTGSITSSDTLTLQADVSDFNNVGDLSVSGTVTGAGTMTLRGANVDVTVSGTVDTNGGNIQINGRSNTTINGDVVTDGGNLQVSASVGGAGTLTISATGLLDARLGAGTGIVTLGNGAGSISNAGEVRSGTGGRVFASALGLNSFITQSGILVSGNEPTFGLTLRAGNGITINAATTGSSSVTMDADFDNNNTGNLLIQGAISAGSTLTLSGTNITDTAAGSLTSQNATIQITSDAVIDLVEPIDSNGGDVFITAGTTLDLGAGTLNSDGGTVTLLSSNSMSLFGPITTSGGPFNADVTAAGTLNINNDITTLGGNVDITSANGLLQSGAGADVNASGGAGASSVRLEALGGVQDLSVGGSVIGGSGGVNLRAGNHLTTTGAVTSSGGIVQLRSDTNGGGVGDVSLGAPVQTTGGGSVLISGIGFVQGGTGTVSAGAGGLAATFTNGVTVSRNLSAAGGISFTAPSIIGNAGVTWTTQNTPIIITASSSTLNLQALLDSNGGPITLQGVVILTSGAGGVVSDGGVVTFAATNGITIGATVTTVGGAFNADVTANGPLQIAADILTLGGNVDITTFNGLLSTTAGADIVATGSGVSGVRLESLNGGQDLTVGGTILCGMGSAQLLAGNNVTLSGQVTASSGNIIVQADTNGGGAGNVILNAPLVVAGAGLIDLSGVGLVQSGLGTVTSSSGTITGAFSAATTLAAAVSSNGGKISITGTSGLTVDAVVSSAPPAGGTGTLHTSTGVVLNIAPVVGNADIILIGTTVTSPNIASATSSAITTTSAVLGGNVTTTGAMPIIDRGVVFSRTSLNNNPVIGGPNVTQVTTSGSTGAFSINATGLTLSTGYSFKAYATNVIGTTYTSPVSTFTTRATNVGLVDESFDVGLVNGDVYTMAVQADGKVLIGGIFSSVGGQPRQNLARLNANGTLDSSFTASADSQVYAIAVQPDSKILVGGSFANVNGSAMSCLARLNADGTLESTATFDVGTGTDGVVTCMALQPDGKILIGGAFSNVGSTSRPRIARLLPDGSVEGSSAFDPGTGPDGIIYTLAHQTDGKILIAGFFANVNGAPRPNIARLLSNGTVENLSTFNPGLGANNFVFTMALQRDGKILIGGSFTQFNLSPTERLARLSANGALDGSFTAAADGIVLALNTQSDGQILVAGAFANVNGQDRSGLARLDTNGANESTNTFSPGTGAAGGIVNSFTLADDGSIYIGGAFTEMNGLPRNKIAKLNNGTATRTLNVIDATTVRLLRSGTAPEASAVLFDVSTDAGATWTRLDKGTRIVGGWELNGVTLPPSGLLRAQALLAGGYLSGSSGIGEQTTSIALPRMVILGNGLPIGNGDFSPNAANDTLFSTTTTPGLGYDEHSFIIQNTGAATLTLPTQPQASGTEGEFRITRMPAPSIPPGGSTSFTVRFNPPLPGAHSSIIAIFSNDTSSNPPNFLVAGTGDLPAPLPQKITFITPPKLFVGQGAVPLHAYSSSGLPVTLSIVAGSSFASLAGNELTPTAPGIVKVAATQAGEVPFKPATPVVRSITIQAAPSSLALTNLLQFYDGLPKPIAVVGNVGVAVINYAGSPIAPTHAGRYPVTADVDGKTLRGSLTILKAPLFVQPHNERRFITEPNPALSINYNGFVGLDDESTVFDAPPGLRPVVSTKAKINSPGGLYPITAQGGKAQDYSLIYIPGHLVVESFAGSYEALLEDSVSNLPVGKLEFIVASNSTSLTGQLHLANEPTPLRFVGTLALNILSESAIGAITPVVKGPNSYSLTLVLPFGQDFSSEVYFNASAFPSAFTLEGRSLLAQPKGRPLGHAGQHTLILAPPLPASPDNPAGSGHATATIDARGQLRLIGRLADGAPFTSVLKADPIAGYRLFARPYKRVQSHLAGWLDLERHPVLPDRRYLPADIANLIWLKAPGLADKSYRSGFGPLTTSVSIDPWLKPSSGQTLTTLLELPLSGNFAVSHGGITSNSLPDLPSDLKLNLQNKIIVTAPANNTTRWATSLNATTGALTGKVTLTDTVPAPSVNDLSATKTVTRSMPFSGVLRQPHGTGSGGPVGAGHALVSPLVTDQPNEIRSGSVLFEP